MSKYDKFINDLKTELNEQEIEDLSPLIIAKYRENIKQKTKRFSFKNIAIICTTIIIVIILIIPSLSKNHQTKPYTPVLPTTVSDTYAFEFGFAANIMINNQPTIKTLSTQILTDVTNTLHKEYLAIRQLLDEDKTTYFLTISENSNYQEKMIITIKYNNFDLECSIYYNKILKEKEEDEETYDLEGIIIINNQEYKISGITEKEEDEIETTIKINLNENNYFIIKQEIEEDEQEFIYSNYENNTLIQKSSLSIEKEKNETEIIIKNKGQINGKTIIKYEKNNLIANVSYDNYKGKIKINDLGSIIKYTFINEKETIEIKILKNFLNNTNKNDFYFVY